MGGYVHVHVYRGGCAVHEGGIDGHFEGGELGGVGEGLGVGVDAKVRG